MEFALSSGSVQGFASRASVAPSQPGVAVCVRSVPAVAGTAYRMGWYGGKEGVRIWRSGWQKGRRQAGPQYVGGDISVPAGRR